MPSIAFTLTGIALLFLSGFWVAALLTGKRDQPEFFASVPVFGLVVSVLWTANLNYLRVPVKHSVIALIVGSAIANIVVLRRCRINAHPDWPTWGVIAGCTLLFVLPYAIFGGFPAFNDAMYYCAVGDFVREYSYFTAPEPAETYPWLSQMLLAQTTGGRMGAQYFLAALSSLTGGDSFSVFIPATACGLFVSFCGFWLVARRLLLAQWAPIAAIAIYGTNIAFVQQPASLNWLSQTVAFGPMLALVALSLRIHSLRWRELAACSLMVAALVSIYPEVLPFAAVPATVFALMVLIQRRQSWAGLASFWIAVIAGSFLLNPYTWFYTLHSVLLEFRATSLGFNFMHLSWWPMDLYFGLAATVRYTNEWLGLGSRIFGGVFLCLAVAGWFHLKRDERIVVAGSGLIYGALALQQLYVHHFGYAFHKILLYAYYVVPLCAGSGLALLWTKPSWRFAQPTRVILIAIWFLFTGITAYRFVVTCYFWKPSPLDPSTLSPAQDFAALTGLRNIAVIPKEGERTLIICPVDAIDRWIPYFFRKPTGDLFPSGYFTAVSDRPLTYPETSNYYLTLRSQTSWKNEAAVLYQNDLLDFSPAQTAMITTNEGWYEAEAHSPGSPQWMSGKAKTLIVAPAPDLISLESQVNVPEDGKPKHLRVTMNGVPAGSFTIGSQGTALVIPGLNVRRGLNELLFRTDEEARQYGADTRMLSLRFSRFRIQADAPSTLNMFNPLELGFVDGLTADRWITGAGVHVRFHAPHQGKPVLDLTGEAVNAAVPGAIDIAWNDGPEVRIPIAKGGRFAGSAVIPTSSDAPDLVLTIKTEHTFRPSDSKTSADKRDLGFRLESLRLRGE